MHSWQESRIGASTRTSVATLYRSENTGSSGGKMRGYLNMVRAVSAFQVLLDLALDYAEPSLDAARREAADALSIAEWRAAVIVNLTDGHALIPRGHSELRLYISVISRFPGAGLSRVGCRRKPFTFHVVKLLKETRLRAGKCLGHGLNLIHLLVRTRRAYHLPVPCTPTPSSRSLPSISCVRRSPAGALSRFNAARLALGKASALLTTTTLSTATSRFMDLWIVRGLPSGIIGMRLQFGVVIAISVPCTCGGVLLQRVLCHAARRRTRTLKHFSPCSLRGDSWP